MKVDGGYLCVGKLIIRCEIRYIAELFEREAWRNVTNIYIFLKKIAPLPMP